MLLWLCGVLFTWSSFLQCTRRLAVICKELGLEYKLIEVDLYRGAHKTKEFLKKQPFGQVPVMDVRQRILAFKLDFPLDVVFIRMMASNFMNLVQLLVTSLRNLGPLSYPLV